MRYSAAIFLAAVMLALAACGGSGGGGEGASEGNGESPPTRAIEHAMGESEVPESPERIAALDNSASDTMVALGVEPAGVTTFSGTDFEGWEYVEDELEGADILGQFVEPNLEAVAALGPDLIIASENSHTEIYDELSEIAPTVVMEDTGGDFREYSRNVGEVLGMEDEVEERIEEYEQNAEEVAGELDEAVGDETVTFFRAMPDRLEIYGNARLVGPILYDDLGLSPGPFVEERAMDEERVEISLESVPELEADHLFVLDQTEDDMEEITGSPLWQSVPAVESGNVYEAGRDTWIAIGLTASEEMIEDVEEALAQ